MNLYIDKAVSLCNEKGFKLLYLVKYGSHLYGTNTSTSDLDIKGIFLPSLRAIALGQTFKHLQYSTGDGHTRNNEKDLDIELYSLQHWLNHLVRKGEIIGLDMLFSYTNKDCVLYCHSIMNCIFDNKDRLISSSDLIKCAYVKYAIGQAKKYGIKGSRLGILKNICEWLLYLKTINNGIVPQLKLDIYIDIIVEEFGDESHCFIKEINGIKSIVICGKVHQSSISMIEFYNRINSAYNVYGERARLAEQNKGIDWKALSHALRSIYQMKQLFTEGMITFPLKMFREIKQIKEGKISWDKVEKMIIDGLFSLEEIAIKSLFTGKWDQKWVDQLVLTAYGLSEE